jgi:hypothetical protein
MEDNSDTFINGRESSIKQLYQTNSLDIMRMANPLPFILQFAIASVYIYTIDSNRCLENYLIY